MKFMEGLTIKNLVNNLHFTWIVWENVNISRLRARNTFAPPQGEFLRQWFSESPISDKYFGRLIATGKCGVCLLSSCTVRYPKTNYFFKSLKVKMLSLYIKCMMFFGVTIHKID